MCINCSTDLMVEITQPTERFKNAGRPTYSPPITHSIGLAYASSTTTIVNDATAVIELFLMFMQLQTYCE